MVLPLIAGLLLLQTAAPDPRLAGGYRSEKAGWVFAHLEGTPSAIGYQYGYLLAPEIDDAQKALRGTEIGKAFSWSWYREESKRVFWPKLDPEYQQELQGLADGLKAKGFDYDVWDMVAFNAHIEIGGYYIPWLMSQKTGKTLSGAKESCSAFVATGSQTKDGKVVMGHNLWWSYIMGQRFNAVLDIKPQKGNEVLMDALCGMIHSGSDFAINSAGIALCETTISGFHGFDPNGIPEFQRMRKAIQYGNSLEDVVRIFKEGNNGGYANTWLLADTRKNEIGRLQLGLKNVIFDRKTDGYYVGANFPEDPKIIKDEVVGFAPQPQENSCLRREARWKTLLRQNKGKVDSELAKAFLADTTDEITGKKGASDSTLCGRGDLGLFPGLGGAVNTKVVTSDSAAKMSIWARMGFSDGSTLIAADYFAKNPDQKYLAPFLRDVPTRPWVTFTAKR